ncbi:tetratricopeptide repeat protein [Tessaracoccus sp. OS52]|uniref:tetratricopeptide repeat protein n=1 Tax=Tessaracoccus sp. OS52 TaxID=2886691 RepID=UPI001D1145E7|nr:tetratricopeptide repeat protein [Tessaracoccus sp. OS52]MCC2593040.1 tetratricopeptide repeat protein [Tessaracoccus sp. OS52]
MTDPNFSRPGAVDLSGLSTPTPQAGGGASYVVEAGEADFQGLANLSMQHPVIVEFHSPRDNRGADLSRTLAELVNAAQGRFLLARVDVDAAPRLAQQLGVQAVPMVVAIIGGQLAPLFQGTRGKEEIQPLLDQVAQLAVANGMTGRAQPVPASGGAEEADAQPAADPRFAAADDALQAGDYARAVEEFDKLLAATPGDAEVIAGRAQAALLQRSVGFDAKAIVTKAAAKPNDVATQLDAADLEVIQGEYAAAFDRLLGLAGELPAEERDPIRVRLLELFEVAGRTDPAVLKARRRLSSLLF